MMWIYSNTHFMSMALARAKTSDDRHKQVGVVIVNASGDAIIKTANTFPYGVTVDVDERHEKPGKYLWVEHAERNAIYVAARNGISLRESIMFTTWFPCVDCARAIIQSGIAELVAVKPDIANIKWNFDVSMVMLNEAGVKIRWYEGE